MSSLGGPGRMAGIPETWSPFMTRDLPFDDDAAATPGDDTAYQIATEVARVARAGAYVTGGALVASHGARDNGSDDRQLDSWNAGWAHSSDPQPDLPSPVVTFPDPVPTFDYDFGRGSGTPGFDEAPTAVVDLGLDDPQPGPPQESRTYGEYPEYHEYYRNTGNSQYTGSDYSTHQGADPLPPAEPPVPAPGYGGGYGPGHDDPSDWWRPDGFGLPGHGTGQPGYDFGLPGLGDQVDPGVNPFLPKPAKGELGTDSAEHSGPRATDFSSCFVPFAGRDLFAGVGEGPGDGFGVWIETDAYAQIWAKVDVDLEIGPKGVYLTTDVRVDASAGLTVKAAAGNNVGDQIDKISEWMDGSRPGANGNRVHEQSGSSPSVPGAGGATPAAGNAGAPAAAPASAPAPAAQPAPVVAAAPAAPVAPAPPPAPAPAPAAPAAAAPVVATPLQTTVQPEAASNPIANVIGSSPNPSPLVVPAAQIPDVLDLPTRTPPP